MTILTAVERHLSNAHYDWVQMRDWSPALLSYLTKERILTDASVSWQDGITCDACGECTCHAVATTPLYAADGESLKGFLVACSSGATVDTLPPDVVRGMKPSIAAFAQWLCTALRTDAASPESCIPSAPDRLWFLGHRRIGETYTPCYLAVGVGKRDAREVFRPVSSLGSLHQALVFTTGTPRESALFPTDRLFPLATILTADERILWLNAACLPGSATDGPVQELPGNGISFPTPAGLRWSEVRLKFANIECVEIFIRDESQGAFGYKELGFVDGRTLKSKSKKPPKPNDAWEHLLLLAYQKGSLTIDQWANGIPEQRGLVSRWKMVLKKHLVALFPDINDGDPIPFGDDHMNAILGEEPAYDAAFRIEVTSLFEAEYRQR